MEEKVGSGKERKETKKQRNKKGEKGKKSNGEKKLNRIEVKVEESRR